MMEDGNSDPRGEPLNWSAEETEEEAEALGKVMSAYRCYSTTAKMDIKRWWRSYQSINPRYQSILAHLPAKYKAIEEQVLCNQMFLLKILQAFDVPDYLRRTKAFEEYSKKCNSQNGEPSVPSTMETDKVRCVLRSIIRDWSAEGADEREMSYLPVLKTLERLYPDIDSRQSIRVLVPGSGLCRLPWEVATRGFTCQGNEFSYYMIIASHFILNCLPSGENSFEIYPWCLQSSNVKKNQDQTRGIPIPDVHPANYQETGNFNLSMASGDFLEVYQYDDNLEAWNVIISCFFLDTAHNVLQYLEVAYGALKPGGRLINFGPLLFHWADMPDSVSIELSLEEVENAAKSLGFIIENSIEIYPNVKYTHNRESMMSTAYECAMFVLLKPP